MILTFSKPEFETKIKNGIKIHTIRADKTNRWKVGMKIHFWLGNPRNTRGKTQPYQFGTGTVSEIKPIWIKPKENRIRVGRHTYAGVVLDSIAKNDGFESWEKMKEFFPEDFEGKLIFWDNCKW